MSKALEAEQLEASAEQSFQEGQAANQLSDDYVLNAVLLASVLFLVGIASRFDWIWVRYAILVAAAALLLYGLYNIATYPIT
jgi:hypothetical protein